MEAKLRSYMFVLMLMVDGFSVETAEVAADLSLKPELCVLLLRHEQFVVLASLTRPHVLQRPVHL